MFLVKKKLYETTSLFFVIIFYLNLSMFILQMKKFIFFNTSNYEKKLLTYIHTQNFSTQQLYPSAITKTG